MGSPGSERAPSAGDAASCPYCERRLETPFCCVSCEQLFRPEREPTPFEAFGLPLNYGVDCAELERRLLRYSRLVHPDFFVTASEDQRLIAEENTAALNGAFEILSDHARRSDWLITALGGPSAGDEKQLPQEFLMEVLEWGEGIEQARGAPAGSEARTALEPLAATLEKRRKESYRELNASLVPPPELGDERLTQARRLLNAIRYLDRTLEGLEALRLEQTSSH
ncbi:MAG: iron-sulfur cluster co-chaperone HscB C-terminal domain-containing protein [Planctomycetota bacterium]|jgi:molecular chaperone HscB|nr:iron-sulfur cluster co-chaperone HscB C-terminal domain-containing protein [Planctomycetota bacterium]MDP6761608.1 iron-sulfur cluster co-chaperone HscB C-terminal domain-containing protein [Planctomycetota bacterium]